MTPAQSRKIQHLGFICIILVAFIHATTFRYVEPPAEQTLTDQLNWSIQSSVAFGFARIAVPFFFLISGFLFFRNLDSNAQLIAKIRRRFLSLVIPYLCWSTLWLIVLGVVTSIESGTDNPIRSLVPDAPLEWLYVWALDPIPGQLWFVRDLIGLSLLSPLLMIGMRWFGFWVPLGLNVAWFLVPENVVIEQRAAWEIISISGIAMFTTGAWLAHAGVDLDRFPRGFELMGLVWVLIVIVTILNPLSSIEIPNPTARLFLDRLSISCGIMTVWTGYRWFANALNVPIVNEFSRHTFFIFAAHYPLLGFLVAMGIKVFGTSAAAQLALFILCPIFVVSLLAILATLISRRLPFLYGLLSGYRGVTRYISGEKVSVG